MTSFSSEPMPPAWDTLALPAFAARSSRRPFVVAFEGANGVGKTTLLRTLSTRLNLPTCLGTDPAWFSEPFKVRMIRDAQWHASALFFLSGCFEQMRTLEGRPEPLILMDRSLWSTLAVHAAESDERLEILLEVLRPMAPMIQIPDMTLVLDASFASCQTRIARKTGIDRALDDLTGNSRFHSRERGFYRWLAARAPGVVTINTENRSAEEVFNEVQSRVPVSC